MKQKVFGCKTNNYFAQKWVKEGELESSENSILLASCVVTDQAKRRWVRFALKTLKTLREGEKIYITGCGVLRNGQVDENFYTTYKELVEFKDKIVLLSEEPEKKNSQKIPGKYTSIGNKQSKNETNSTVSGDTGGINQAETFGQLQNQQLQKKFSVSEKIANIKKQLASSGELTRKTLVIQTGCDNFCTFCLTVQARGRHAYRPAEDIIDEINEYISVGGKEVVLTGINLGAWGADSSLNHKDSRLAELVHKILSETTIERLRISSLGVEFLVPEVIELFANPRIIAYAHLSIQSGSDAILQAMRRQYSRAELLDRLKALGNITRADGVKVQIGADLIVGFPGETDADWIDTWSLVDIHGVTQLHAFPFSAHTDKYHVPAGSYPNQIPEHIKLKRLRELIELGDKRKAEFESSQRGKSLKLLLEGTPTENSFKGWSQNYIELTEKNFEPNAGSIFKKGSTIEGIFH